MPSSMIGRYVQMVNSIEGRDKLSKVIVYGGRFLYTLRFLRKYNDKLARLRRLSEACADMRRLCRLFKSASELNVIHKLLTLKSKENEKVDEFNRLFSILVRASYALYYFFDNIYILEKVNFFKNKSPEKKGSFHIAMDFWFIGLVLRAILQLRNILRIHHQEIKLRQKLIYLKNEQENIEAHAELAKLKSLQNESILWLIRTLADILPSFKSSDLALKLLKVTVNDSLAWAGGLVSALIACYSLY